MNPCVGLTLEGVHLHGVRPAAGSRPTGSISRHRHALTTEDPRPLKVAPGIIVAFNGRVGRHGRSILILILRWIDGERCEMRKTNVTIGEERWDYDYVDGGV
jgi:hypothetical protein